jgi:CBS domain-containing protein
MITNVITVGTATPVSEIANILLTNHISAVPVLDDKDELVGVVSEGDLIRRVETGTERRRSWWLELFADNELLAQEYVKSHARKAADVMTRHVITASEDTPLAEIATLLERHQIKRVPILRGRKVVGIVSRANLLQALASLREKVAPSSAPDDAAIRAKVMEQLQAQPWGVSSLLNVTVQNGVVDLWGLVSTAQEKNAIRVAAEITDGVRAVNDNIVVRPLVMGS